MQTQTRLDVFETNSSSSHSLTLAGGEGRNMGMIAGALKSGVLTVEMGEFYGWGWKRLYRPESKIAYLLIEAGADIDHLQGEPGVADYIRRRAKRAGALLDTIEAYTGCRVQIDVTSDFIGIDGESRGVARQLLKDPEATLDFIFNTEAYVQLGNDNSPAGELVESDIDQMIEMYPKRYRDAGQLPKGQEITFETGRFHKEATVTIGDEVLWTTQRFSAGAYLADVMHEFAVTGIEATVYVPQGRRREPRNIEEMLGPDLETIIPSEEKLAQMARDGFFQFMDDLGEEAQLTVERNIEFSVSHELRPGAHEYNMPRPLYRMTGIATPDTVIALRERMQALEAQRLQDGPRP